MAVTNKKWIDKHLATIQKYNKEAAMAYSVPIKWANSTTYGTSASTYTYTNPSISYQDDFYDRAYGYGHVPQIDSPRYVEQYSRDGKVAGYQIYWSDGISEFLPDEKLDKLGSPIRETDHGTYYLREYAKGHREAIPKPYAMTVYEATTSNQVTIKGPAAIEAKKKDPMTWLREQNEAVQRLTRAA